MPERTFADSLDADLANAFLNASEFAQAFRIAREDGTDPQDMTGVASQDTAERSLESPGVIVGYSRHVLARFAGQYQPRVHDVVTIGSVEYTVIGPERQAGNAWRLALHRAAATEITRGNYRRAK